MNYTLTPSLKHIALVKIATTLWNQDDIRALIAKFYIPKLRHLRRAKWQKLGNKVIEKVPQLSLPESLKEEILVFYIQPIGIQILIIWTEYHDCYRLHIDPNDLCWTPQGTVDNKKTAEALIRDERTPQISKYSIKHYKLARIYCLEDDILELSELWNKIPENHKSFYCEELLNFRQKQLVEFWAHDIKGEVDNLDNMIERRQQLRCSPYQFAFENAAVGGNKAATEYFLQKLTSREREESLIRTTAHVASVGCTFGEYRGPPPYNVFYIERWADVLCFLLSQMDEEQQMEVFKKNSYDVLICLLDWPWQSLFMETANRMWDFLSEKHYNAVLRMMIDKVINGFKDCNYQKLFGEFWQQIPNAHKRYIIDECASGSLLSKLFKIKNVGNIKLILKDATFIEKKKLIFSDIGKDICQDLIYDDKWDLLKFFVQECICSKDIMVKFKEEFKKFLLREKLMIEKDLWSKIFPLLDDLIQKDDKKRCEEERNFSPVKRLHSMEFEEVTHSMKKNKTH